MNKIQILVLLVTIFFLSSCGRKKDLFLLKREIADSSVIIGKLNWRNIDQTSNFKKEILKNASLVGRFYISRKRLNCSAIIVDEDILLTSKHCIPEDQDLSGGSVIFKYQIGAVNKKNIYLCQKLLGVGLYLDYALIKCQGKPGRRFGIAAFDLDLKEDQRKIYLIHHNCIESDKRACRPYKKISNGIVERNSNDHFFHNADTKNGSSGGGVFNLRNHRLLGIHSAGEHDLNQRPLRNHGLFLKSIVLDIEERFPSVKLNY